MGLTSKVSPAFFAQISDSQQTEQQCRSRQSYGLGIIACIWVEYPLSTPVAPTAVLT
jgi:hypothetical protein